MNRCPELFELEAFFEVPATSRYGNDREGWFYDCLRFERSADGERIACEIEPAEGEFRFMWSVGGHVRLDIQLRFVRSLEISASAGVEHLIGRVEEGGLDQMFKLNIRPSVVFQLGTGLPKW